MEVLRTWKERITTEDVGHWLNRSKDHDSYRAIELPGKGVSDDTMALILSLAMRCSNLRILKLGQNEITDLCAVNMGTMLSIGVLLTHLDLSRNKIGSQGAEAVASTFLNQAAKLQEADEIVLDLSDNEIGEKGLIGMARSLGPHRQVRLRLRKVGCTGQALKEILASKQALIELDVAQNPIGVAGLEAARTMVIGGAPWHRLCLSQLVPVRQEGSDKLGRRLAAPLAAVLSKSAELRDLACGGNNLGDTGSAQVVDALCKSDPQALERFALGDSGCALQAAKSLRCALGGKGPVTPLFSGGLWYLDLEGNRFDDDCAKALAEGLEHSVALQELRLARNHIKCKGVTLLANALRKQRKLINASPGNDRPGCLVELDLSKNPVGDDGAKALADAAREAAEDPACRLFQAPWGLERLHLGETRIGDKGCNLLCMAVASRAALADTCVASLRERKILTVIQAHRVRRPRGLEVLGLRMDDESAADLRDSAHARMQCGWPDPDTVISEPSEPSLSRQVSEESMTREVSSGPSVMLGPGSVEAFDLVDDYFGAADESDSRIALPQAADSVRSSPVQVTPVPSMETSDHVPTPAPPSFSSSSASGLAGRVNDTRSAREKAQWEEMERMNLQVERKFREAAANAQVERTDLNTMQSKTVDAQQKLHVSAIPSDSQVALHENQEKELKQQLEPSEPEVEPSLDADTTIMEPCAEIVKADPSYVETLPAESMPLADGVPLQSSNVQAASPEAPAIAPPAKAPAKGLGKAAPPGKAPPGKGPPGKAPPPKGLGKGKGAGPPQQDAQETLPAGKAKGKGKGGPPPPKKAGGGAPPPKGKAKAARAKSPSGAKAKAEAKAKDLADGPFSRKLHWVQPTYEEPEGQTIFGELQDSFNFDPTLLEKMFGQQDKKGARRKSVVGMKASGVVVLDANRAQNMAIVLQKVQLPTSEICECLQDLDFSHPRLSIDNVELLMTAMPTPEETKKLLEHRNKIHELRDIEQKIMPFCLLPRSTPRLKLLKLALSHPATYKGLLQRCTVLIKAAEEARKSKELRSVLSVVLKVGNFINHGAKELRAEGAARAFAIESLHTLASYKVGTVSVMHFICLNILNSDESFLQKLKQSMLHIPAAAKENSLTLKGAIEAFGVEMGFARREMEQVQAGDGDAAVQERMAALVQDLTEETDELRTEVERMLKLGNDVQKYFNISDKKVRGQAQKIPPIEQFFDHLATFLNNFEFAWLAVENDPDVRKKFSLGMSGRSKVKEVGQARRASSKSMAPANSPATSAPEDEEKGFEGKRRTGVGSLRRFKTTTVQGINALEDQDECSRKIRSKTDPVQDNIENTSERRPSAAGTTTTAQSLSADVPFTPQRHRTASARTSEAGSDVGLMIDVDDLIESIFTMSPSVNSSTPGSFREVESPFFPDQESVVSGSAPSCSSSVSPERQRTFGGKNVVEPISGAQATAAVADADSRSGRACSRTSSRAGSRLGSRPARLRADTSPVPRSGSRPGSHDKLHPEALLDEVRSSNTAAASSHCAGSASDPRDELPPKAALVDMRQSNAAAASGSDLAVHDFQRHGAASDASKAGGSDPVSGEIPSSSTLPRSPGRLTASDLESSNFPAEAEEHLKNHRLSLLSAFSDVNSDVSVEHRSEDVTSGSLNLSAAIEQIRTAEPTELPNVTEVTTPSGRLAVDSAVINPSQESRQGTIEVNDGSDLPCKVEFAGGGADLYRECDMQADIEEDDEEF